MTNAKTAPATIQLYKVDSYNPFDRTWHSSVTADRDIAEGWERNEHSSEKQVISFVNKQNWHPGESQYSEHGYFDRKGIMVEFFVTNHTVAGIDSDGQHYLKHADQALAAKSIIDEALNVLDDLNHCTDGSTADNSISVNNCSRIKNAQEILRGVAVELVGEIALHPDIPEKLAPLFGK